MTFKQRYRRKFSFHKCNNTSMKPKKVECIEQQTPSSKEWDLYQFAENEEIY